MTKSKFQKGRNIKKSFASPFSFYWTNINYSIFIAGTLLLILGFYLMSVGYWDDNLGLVVSPILLVIAYGIVIPASILFIRIKKSNTEKHDSGKS